MRILESLALLLALLVIAVRIVMRGPLGPFLSAPDMLLVFALPLLLQWATLGAGSFGRFLGAFRILVGNASRGSVEVEQVATMRLYAAYLYATGAMGVLISLVQFLGWYQATGEIGAWTDLAPVSLVYAIILAECIVRPCVNQLEYLLARENEIV